MPQDSFHIRRQAEELNALLSHGKVNRISQSDKDEVTFIIYTKNSTLKLVFNTNASFARITVQDTENPSLLVPPSFCMLLRKHLLGGEILSVKQVENERIVAVTFLCFNDFSDGEKILYAELMGKYSNLILTEENLILGALKSSPLENSSGRALFSGVKYALPPKQDKIAPNDASLKEKWQLFLNESQFTNDGGSGEIYDYFTEACANFLFTNVAGIAASTAREIVATAKRRNIKIVDFPDFFTQFFFNEPVDARLIQENGAYTDFFAFFVEGSEPVRLLNDAQSKYFVQKAQNRSFNEKRQRLLSVTNSKIKKCEKNLADTLSRLSEAEKADEFKIKGELLTANLYKIEKNAEYCFVENWYDGGKKEKIPLDKRLFPSANAQKFFKTYAKLKRTKENLEPRKEEEERALEYYLSVRSFLNTAESVDDLTETEEELRLLGWLPQEKSKKKKAEISVPFRTYEIDGFTVLAGRNNVSNDRLLKTLSPEDIWLHVQKYHSAHVGILTEKKDVPDEVLLKAAQICARYSEAKHGETTAVDYTLKKYVRKPKKAALGFVTYTMQKTLYVRPCSTDF